MPLDYHYEPGSPQDGVTLGRADRGLGQVTPEPLGWLVPGLLEEKVLALIRSLPKSLRTRFVPAPDTAKRVVPLLRFGEGDIHAAVAAALSHLGGVPVPPDAFQEDRLPLELRMNIRVTDADGRQLAAGRDLGAIRRELGQQAADSFSRVEDPRWNRDGLTEWDFDALPAEIELPRGRLSVKAYPALVDRGDSVSLRLVDSPRRAEHETHFGLRRLCFLATRRELKNASGLAAEPRCDGTFRRRRSPASIFAGSLPSCWPIGPWWPISPCREPRTISCGCWPPAVSGLRGPCRSLPPGRPIFEGYQQASLAVEEFCTRPAHAPSPGATAARMGATAVVPEPTRAAAPVTRPAPRWQYAVDDMRQQIAQLMDSRFFATAPWDWLRQYPRYFRALCCRLENLPGNVPRDWEKFQDFQPRWQLYLDRARHQQAQGIVDPRIAHLRWMLEEYRVSLFAQKFGTAIPVSPKRLEQQWAKLRV